MILSGGETTVTIRPRAPGAAKGRGGRAGEFCLGLRRRAAGASRTCGRWPPTPTASTASRTTPAPSSRPTRWRAPQALGLKLADHLDRNDAYGYFDALGDLLVTGPTHTNVNDFRALVIL